MKATDSALNMKNQEELGKHMEKIEKSIIKEKKLQPIS